MTAALTRQQTDALVEGLYTDGIVAERAAFAPEWVDRLGEDIEALFQDALARPRGAVGRGPNRYYVEIHPERLRGFVDLVTHPWEVRRHLACRVVDRLEPIEQRHTIEGLVMGAP